MLDQTITDYDEPVRAILTLAEGFSAMAAGVPGSNQKTLVLVGVRLFNGETAVVPLDSPESVDTIVASILSIKKEVWGD